MKTARPGRGGEFGGEHWMAVMFPDRDALVRALERLQFRGAICLSRVKRGEKRANHAVSHGPGRKAQGASGGNNGVLGF